MTYSIYPAYRHSSSRCTYQPNRISFGDVSSTLFLEGFKGLAYSTHGAWLALPPDSYDSFWQLQCQLKLRMTMVLNYGFLLARDVSRWATALLGGCCLILKDIINHQA